MIPPPVPDSHVEQSPSGHDDHKQAPRERLGSRVIAWMRSHVVDVAIAVTVVLVVTVAVALRNSTDEQLNIASSVSSFHAQTDVLRLQVEQLSLPTIDSGVVDDSEFGSRDMLSQGQEMSSSSLDSVCATVVALQNEAARDVQFIVPELREVPNGESDYDYERARELSDEIESRADDLAAFPGAFDDAVTRSLPLCRVMLNLDDPLFSLSTTDTEVAPGTVMQLPAGAVTCTDRFGCPSGGPPAWHYGLDLGESHSAMALAFEPGCGSALSEACALAETALSALADNDYETGNFFAAAMSDDATSEDAAALQTAMDEREATFAEHWAAVDAAAVAAVPDATDFESALAIVLESQLAELDEVIGTVEDLESL